MVTPSQPGTRTHAAHIGGGAAYDAQRDGAAAGRAIAAIDIAWQRNNGGVVAAMAAGRAGLGTFARCRRGAGCPRGGAGTLWRTSVATQRPEAKA